LRTKLYEDGRESADLGTIQKQLAADLEDEREQHQKDLAERDFTVDQTRKKYQGTRLSPRRLSGTEYYLSQRNWPNSVKVQPPFHSFFPSLTIVAGSLQSYSHSATT
jgi:hypothetical protein